MYPNYNPYGFPMAYQPPRPALPQQQIMTVASIDSFSTMQATPNTSFLAMHQNEPILFVCQVDGTGKVTPTPYDISPYKSPEQVAQANIETQLAEIRDRLKRIEVHINGQSNPSNNDE